MTEAHRPTWVDDELFPFESRFIDIDGHRIHYVDEGAGPVLLFLHGNPTWSFDYRKVIDALRTEFRCIAVDYPVGHRLRRSEGLPLLMRKFERSVQAHFGAKQAEALLQLAGDGAGLDDMPVNEFMAAMATPAADR